MDERHKHAELIIAWANGAEIEFYSFSDNDWLPTPKPEWSDFGQYRIAKKPEPPLERHTRAQLDIMGDLCLFTPEELDDVEMNLKLYFDPETQKLIKAEVI